MFDPQMELLFTVLNSVVNPEDGTPPKTWLDVKAAAAVCGAIEDEELGIVIELEDADAAREIIDQWLTGKRHFIAHDRDVLKRAMKAYRKRLKITLLDAESSLGGGVFSTGRQSEIAGITPPTRYPASVWEELARQKRLIHSGQGTYELPPGG